MNIGIRYFDWPEMLEMAGWRRVMAGVVSVAQLDELRRSSPRGWACLARTIPLSLERWLSRSLQIAVGDAAVLHTRLVPDQSPAQCERALHT
jgi:hypothetical protein